MIVADLVKIGAKMMETLSRHGIDIGDYQYIWLFEEYEEMVSHGDKVSYIVAHLSEKYNISERSIYRVLKRLGATAKF